MDVSVVIPAWNACSTITDCLRSVKKQTVPPLEILLIDDGSDDCTVDVAAEYGVTLLKTGGRKGPATARNTGANAAEGDIVLFLDSDVTIPPHLIERVVSHFLNPSVWAVQSLYSPTCPASNTVSRYQNYYYFHCFNRIQEHETATFATWCAAIRREKFIETGGFNTKIPEPTVEDEELGYTIADSGGTIFLDKNLQVTHLASYTLSQFTGRRLRMARAQAKSGWRQIKSRLLARYMNVRESGTHHSRWVVLSIVLVLAAETSLLAGLVFWLPELLLTAIALLFAALLCHFDFLKKSTRDLGGSTTIPFALLTVYDMAVLGWGIVHGSVQYALGKKY